MNNCGINKASVRNWIIATVITFVFILTEWIASMHNFFGNGARLFLIDSSFRVIFGIIGMIVLVLVCKENIKEIFTSKIPKKVWFWLIPVFAYFISYIMLIPMVDKVTGEWAGFFLVVIIQQIATGFYEEIVSRGIIMSSFRKDYDKLQYRLIAVFSSGIIFGLGHILNFLFGGSIVDSIFQAFITSGWGMFVAAIYMVSDNLILVMFLHTLWDILIRIPDYFFILSNETNFLADISTGIRNIIDPYLLVIIAIVICFKYDK